MKILITEEFDRLNKVINNLTEKLRTDWLSLKKFTENASHEIQTPLSNELHCFVISPKF